MIFKTLLRIGKLCHNQIANHKYINKAVYVGRNSWIAGQKDHPQIYCPAPNGNNNFIKVRYHSQSQIIGR